MTSNLTRPDPAGPCAILPLDPTRRKHVVAALQDALAAHHDRPEAAEAAANDLLRRMGVTWEQLLSHPVNPADPLLVRQADCMASLIFEFREHAEPAWLAAAAVWHRAAPTDPEAHERLRTMLCCVQGREEARLEALRVQIEEARRHQMVDTVQRVEAIVGPTLLTSVVTAGAS